MTVVDTVIRFVLAVLLNGLWEAALLAALAWLVLRAMPNGNATTRHWVLSAALFGALAGPVFTTWFAWPHERPVAIQHVPARTTDAAKPAVLSHPATSHVAMPPLSTAAAGTNAQAAGPAPATALRLNVALPRWLAFALVAVWLAGALFVLVRLVVSLLHLERLKTDALPVSVEYRAQLVRWSAAMKGSRSVRLCRSPEVEIPIAVGLFDAMILVPERLLEELPPEDVDRIVLHELAHLRRADDWINAIERIAQAALFFNPGILWLIAQLDLEREVACDDWVLQQNEPLPYATCLTKVVENAMWPYRAMSAPGAFVTRRGMSIRIERLLTRHRDVRVRTSPAPAAFALGAIAALVFVAALVSPSIAFTGATAVVAATPAKPAASPRPAKAAKPAATAAAAVTAAATQTQPVPTSVSVVVNVATTPPAAAVAARATAPARALPVPVPAPSAPQAGVLPVPPGAPAPARVAATSPDYIDELAAAGYTNVPIEQLIQLKAVGVTGAYIRDLAANGVNHPSVKELVQLRAMDVTPAYIGAMRSVFGQQLDVSSIVRLRAVGVTPSYASDVAKAGYPNLTPEQMEQFKAVGIDAAFIQRANAHGFHNLTTEQLIRLKVTGIL